MSEKLIGICSTDGVWVHLIGLFIMRLTYVALYCIRLVINEPVLVGPPTMPAVTPLGADKWLTGIWAQSLVYSAILRRILTVKAVCILFLTAVWWHNGHKKIVMPKATSARDTGTVHSLHLHNYYWPVGDRLIVWTSTGFWYLLQPLALQRQISIYNMEMNTFNFWRISQFLLLWCLRSQFSR